MSSNLEDEKAAYDIIPVAFSDHSFVTTKIGCKKPNRASDTRKKWKLYDSILGEGFALEFHGEIENVGKSGAISAVKWETSNRLLVTASMPQAK